MEISLNYLDEDPLREIANLPLVELTGLAERLKTAGEVQDRRKKVLAAALKGRFGGTASDLLHREGKDVGTVRFEEGEALIVAQFRKKVEWDQEALAHVLSAHPELKQTIKCSYSVEERQYGTLPESQKALFAEARTVKVAGCEFSIQLKEDCHA